MKAHIFCIVDRSGSMGGLEQATIDGYNEYIDELREENADLTLVLFDNEYEIIVDGRPIKSVPKLDKDTYYVRGGTALVDAVCRTINERKGRVGKQERAIVLIITDGMENASMEYKARDMKKLIDSLEEKKNWKFVYLGSNQDAWAVAQDYGFKNSSVATYGANVGGLNSAFSNITTSSINMMRTAAPMAATSFFTQEQKGDMKDTV